MAHARRERWLAVAREPYALTLYEYLMMLETDRLERLTADARDLKRASMQACATHAPAKLQDYSDDFLTAVRAVAYPDGRDDGTANAPARRRRTATDVRHDDARARAQAIADLLASIERPPAADAGPDGSSAPHV